MDRFSHTIGITLAMVAVLGAVGCKSPPPTTVKAIATEPNQLLWGDTHVHAGQLGQTGTETVAAVNVDTAHRWAKGLPVVHPETKAKVQLKTPLDFLIVTDDGARLGDGAWVAAAEAADRHYAPCRFTSFIGWRWSSELDGQNLHRVVFMKQGLEQAREFTPFSASEGAKLEDLWAWLAETSNQAGVDFIAIPHPPFLGETSGSNRSVITEETANTRMRWEPVASLTQMNGDFETHPTISPNDPFANFENSGTRAQEDFARTALLRGLQIDQRIGVNPFEFGLVGSTGSTTGLATADEDHFVGATSKGAADLSAQGLTGVWADENTRQAIFDAFERKEVYATTGPRIRVRFFGGWGFSKKAAGKPDMVNVGYTLGRPMGSRMTKPPKDDSTPKFLMYAVKDPNGANLDRIQIIKGWVDGEGVGHEKVYDVVWSGDRARDANGNVPPIEDPVDLKTGTSNDNIGASALHATWSDPKFDGDQHAFYYVRVLQVPSPRHTTYNALAQKRDPNQTGHPATIQERAYTSPIWYSP